MESLMYFQEPADQEPDHPSDTCAACGSSKRSSPYPKRERPIPLHSSVANHHGFTKIPLPTTTPANWVAQPPSYQSHMLPLLCRCSSDPVPPLLNAVPPQLLENSMSPTREGSSAKRGLCRSLSAPESDLINATDPSKESPNSKRLKRMKDRMKEISKWCDQVITEVDEEDEDEDEGEDHLVGAEVVNNEAPKDDDDCGGSETEEAVSVEKKGESLIIHMKCPCSKAYQFLLSGNNCYYKLM